MKFIRNTILVQCCAVATVSQLGGAMGLRGSARSSKRALQTSVQDMGVFKLADSSLGGAGGSSSLARQMMDSLTAGLTIPVQISTSPSESVVPSTQPSMSSIPSIEPSEVPSALPPIELSGIPSTPPSTNPSRELSSLPSSLPSSIPSTSPSESPAIVGGGDLVSFEVSTRPIDQQAIYDVTFTNLWSASRHPPLYPSSAHWSPPVCVAHSSSYQMWSPGTLSTPGVQVVAETGATGVLFGELDDAGNAIGGTVRGRVTFNDSEQSQSIAEFIVDEDRPFVSTITMVAPSPDWFTGFYDLEPVSSSGNWWRSFTVETYPFDAGTDSGLTYQSRNQATNPHESIFELRPDMVPSSNVFLLNGDTVLPVGQWTFVLRE